MTESGPRLSGFEPSIPSVGTTSHESKPEQLDEHQLRTLRVLCDLIIPPDADSPGAVEAGAPEFISLLASEKASIGLCISGGLRWLDSIYSMRHGRVFANCSEAEQHEVLDILAHREKAARYPALQPGFPFFALIRRLTLDGFFTSAIGYQYLRYMGNDYVSSFEGCPPVPEP